MPMHQELPEQFGRYRILNKLGVGGMGRVYLAEDTKLRRKVALKVPHFSAGTRAVGLERFQREARLAASIEHPNFCPVHDVDEIDGIHFFTMAYLEGTPLSELIADEQPWPPQQAVEMVRRVALAVGELHSRGIVHRDLKPANIMVRPSGEPVLMDFGLAFSLTSQSERLTGSGEVLGTLAYIPPEQLEGDRARLGPAADIYSLGMILYELLTGQVPFAGSSLLVVAQVGSKVPELPSTLQPGLDARLDAICRKALAKQPEDRFPDTFAFVAALEEFLRTPGEQCRTCFQCGGLLTVPPALVGQKMKCPHCGPVLAPATMPQPPSSLVRAGRETLPPRALETATRPRWQPLRSRWAALVLVLLMLIVTGVLVGGILFWPPDEGMPEAKPPGTDFRKKGEEPPPPPAASLRLDKLEPVRIKAGQKKTVPVKVRRENCAGPIQLVAAVASPSVTVHGQVDEGTEEGSLELMVAADAKPGGRTLRLRAFAVAGAGRAEGELSLMIEAADSPPPPPKPSLHLEELAPVRVEAGQSKTVPVKINRKRCPGPVQVELAKASSRVTVRNGLVGNDSEEGTVEVVVAADAKPGERTLRLRAVAAAAKTEGDLPLIVLSSELPDQFVNTSKMPMVRIKKGTFKMGAPAEDKEKFDDEVAQHLVKITRDFYMGATEVTVGQFKQFVEEEGYKTEAETDGRGGEGYNQETGKLEGPKPIFNWKHTGWKQDEDHPVVNVTWNDAKKFCAWLSKKENKAYDLPTEAEWEYACRAGTSTRYHSGEDPEELIRVGNVADASAKAKFAEWMTIKGDDGYVFTAPVRKFKPNAWGLYDMHGNAWEWCKDGPRKYPKAATAEKQKDPLEDPEGPRNGTSRVLRGGSWGSFPKNCRCTVRYGYAPTQRSHSIGFRIVLRPGLRAP